MSKSLSNSSKTAELDITCKIKKININSTGLIHQGNLTEPNIHPVINQHKKIMKVKFLKNNSKLLQKY